jgi:A/G-specific adenine glycosylase
MVPADDPGGFNQALMDLGATLCTPRAPRCGECPLADPCVARAQGRPEDYPAKTPRRPVPHHDIAVGVVTRGGRLLLVRRPEEALLGGLWEFPGGRLMPGETPEVGVVRALGDRFGLAVRPGGMLLAPVAHAFTHRRVTLHPFACRAPRGAVRPMFHTEHRWVAPGGLDALALPRAHRKIVAALAAPGLFDREDA